MNRRAKGILLIASLAVAAVATAVVLPSLALTAALTRGFAQNRCEIGFRSLIIGCKFHSSRTITSTPSSPPTIDHPAPFGSGSIDETSRDVTDYCPLGPIARRLLCAAAATPANDDLKVEQSEATGLAAAQGPPADNGEEFTAHQVGSRRNAARSRKHAPLLSRRAGEARLDRE
jgi:hypothetical protein